MKAPQTLQFLGWILLFTGLLTSPVKQYTLRCWSNPMGWLEAQCEAFREMHSPVGYLPLAVGTVLIVASILARRKESEND